MESIPNESVINYGDLVVIYEKGDSVKYFTLEKNKTFQNKNGLYKHDSVVGKHPGSRIYPIKGDKFVVVLSFVPNIWERCINKITQILYNPDISMIMTLLNVTQSSIIYESGTGSGCLSTNLSSVLDKEYGHLYTFEFNKERADKLKGVFELLKLNEKLTILNRDVVEKGFELSNEEAVKPSHKQCDCMFIDLPSPWLIIEKAKKVLKKGAQFVSFSPCIEQITQTCKEMRKNGFIELRMFECMYRTYGYARTQKVIVPKLGQKTPRENIEFEEKEVSITKNKGDMRGHTGFLLFAINAN